MTTHNLSKIRLLGLLLLMVLGAAARAFAFDVDVYADASRLAEGRWVKVSVAETGMHLISTSDLRQWGFSDPSRVRIYGYGGERLSDVLRQANYIDDLPEVSSVVTSRGLVFYAVGTVSWSLSGPRYVHKINPFSSVGYYYLTESDEPRAPLPRVGEGRVTDPATCFTEHILHEQEITKLGETGHQLVGEDFKWTSSRQFKFDLQDIDTSEPVTMAVQFVSRTIAGSSSLKFTANGTTLPSANSDNIGSTNNSAHNHGVQTLTVKSFDVADRNLTVGITYSASTLVSAAHLDYIELNYKRRLRMADGLLHFRLGNTQVRLEGADEWVNVWDVTDPLHIFSVNTAKEGGSLVWTNDYTGSRTYAAWTESAKMPAPAYVGVVANQNLHSPAIQPDMVIFCRPEWQSQARRVADLHTAAPDSLTVVIVDPEEVYNEFSSGSPDVVSLRRYLKMLWDRGLASGRPLRYAMLIGQPTFDNRRISDKGRTISYPTLPTWQSDASLDDNSSYTTDDIFGFLLDGSGQSLGSDELCIAVGRMPARSLGELTKAVDKLYDYYNRSTRSSWRNQVLLLADDENSGIHMEQSEDTWRGMMKGTEGDRFFYTKVYIDAFEKKNGTYPLARDRMFRRLDEGLLWWNYIGHANPTSWTSEGILTYNDINNLYIRDYPVLYAATCEFLNWDSTTPSGAEILYHTEGGGIIAAITAVRPVYISDNGALGKAFAPMIFNLDDNGRFLTLGEIYRRGKNNLRDSKGAILNNPNKLRYVLMGDPAMHLATPSARVVLDRINGEEVTEDAQVTIMARQLVTLEGHIETPDGQPLHDFAGDISVDIYDSEYSTTSNGYGDGKRVVFEEQGARLYSGRDSVAAGRFVMRVPMPETIANNFRPAAINMYATSTAGVDAMGVNRQFYVYGFDENAEPDTVAPRIREMYLNHPTFVDGDRVNTTPMLFARVEDNLGFNLSTQGIGHSFSLQIDGSKAYTDLSQYFTPDMGSLSGTIAYPMDPLAEGPHSLRLRVWDTFANYAEHTIDCYVTPGLTPEVYEVYTDANPASVEANFYVTHNRPDAMMSVTIEVFNLLGQPVWSANATQRSDSFTTAPVTWNLTDLGGHRVKRGIYLYRATISEKDGTQHVTRTSRIAVTAR